MQWAWLLVFYGNFFFLPVSNILSMWILYAMIFESFWWDKYIFVSCFQKNLLNVIAQNQTTTVSDVLSFVVLFEVYLQLHINKSTSYHIYKYRKLCLRFHGKTFSQIRFTYQKNIHDRGWYVQKLYIQDRVSVWTRRHCPGSIHFRHWNLKCISPQIQTCTKMHKCLKEDDMFILCLCWSIQQHGLHTSNGHNRCGRKVKNEFYEWL